MSRVSRVSRTIHGTMARPCPQNNGSILEFLRKHNPDEHSPNGDGVSAAAMANFTKASRDDVARTDLVVYSTTTK